MEQIKSSLLKSSRRVKVLILLVTVLLIVFMFPKGESIESEVTIGSIWIQDDLIAPFSFPIYKDPELYRIELQKAAEGIYPVFIRNDDVIRSSLDSMHEYNKQLLKFIDDEIEQKFSEPQNPSFLTLENYTILKNLRRQEKNLTSSRRLTMNRFFQFCDSLLKSAYKNGILSIEYEQIKKDSIAIRVGNIDKIEPKVRYLTLRGASNLLPSAAAGFNAADDLKRSMVEYTGHFLTPNIIYSPENTAEEVEQAQNKVSQYAGIVNENERIIAKHDRITKEIKLKIDSYKIAKGEKLGKDSSFLQGVGKFLHISFILLLLSLYIFLFRKKIYNDNRKILLFSIIFLFISFITFLVNQMNVKVPVQLIIFIPAASMLITIIFDSRVGFYSTVILSLIIGGLRGNDYTFVAMNILAGALAVYTVRDIKNRTQIFRSFIFILIGYTISILAFAMERFEAWDVILVELAFASSNALISPVLTYGLLIFFEKSFKITTDLTLLELSNFDRPLLRELARKAPGTFNHSMTMGTLAESAAEQIGANPLLARVGAYYHDIGKTITPQNFVENQLNNQNIHENLSPEESIKLIIDHVKEGIDLANQDKLPQEIIDFIPMHHGTTTISYFLDKAKKLYGEENVNEEDFKYPGLKPTTKETAIVMLADACESTVRSIENPDPVKVENVIEKLIGSRIDEGQLDDSPLTMKDIRLIKEAFINILLGQHHKRIRYPKQEEMEQGVDEKEE